MVKAPVHLYFASIYKHEQHTRCGFWLLPNKISYLIWSYRNFFFLYFVLCSVQFISFGWGGEHIHQTNEIFRSCCDPDAPGVIEIWSIFRSRLLLTSEAIPINMQGFLGRFQTLSMYIPFAYIWHLRINLRQWWPKCYNWKSLISIIVCVLGIIWKSSLNKSLIRVISFV